MEKSFNIDYFNEDDNIYILNVLGKGGFSIAYLVYHKKF